MFLKYPFYCLLPRLIEAHNYMEGADLASTLLGPLLLCLALSTFRVIVAFGIDVLTFLLSFLIFSCLKIHLKTTETHE